MRRGCRTCRRSISPAPGNWLQSLIVSNTETEVVVWGDFASLGLAGNTYQINDDHMTATSPRIDAADNTAVPKGSTTDCDGDPRLVDDPATTDTGNGEPPIVDMGVYEFPNTDSDQDGNINSFDIEPFLECLFGP